MKRVLIAASISLPVTFCLFLLMASLISNNVGLKKSVDSENFIDFIRSIPNSQLNARKRSKPKKPPEPKTPPKMPKMAVKQAVDNNVPAPSMTMPMLEAPLALGNGPYIGGSVGGAASKNSDAVPLVRVNSPPSRKARMQRINGFVIVQFDIEKSGAVSNARIVRSKPRRLNDKIALNDIRKWKYRPKMVDGKPVAQKGITVQLDYRVR